MDSKEEEYCRNYIIFLSHKLRCSPEELSSMYSFGGSFNKVIKRLVYENEEA